jgi:hypothetical protein
VSKILDVESFPFIAGVLSDNERILEVFRRLEFTTHSVPGGTSEAVLKLKE